MTGFTDVCESRESRRSSLAEMRKTEGRILDVWGGSSEFHFGYKFKMCEKTSSGDVSFSRRLNKQQLWLLLFITLTFIDTNPWKLEPANVCLG